MESSDSAEFVGSYEDIPYLQGGSCLKKKKKKRKKPDRRNDLLEEKRCRPYPAMA